MAPTTLEKYELRIGKVISPQANRAGFSTALLYQPDRADEREHGELLFVIDIASPSPIVPDIAFNLIKLIKEEYYAELDRSPEESFEQALRVANEELGSVYRAIIEYNQNGKD